MREPPAFLQALSQTGAGGEEGGGGISESPSAIQTRYYSKLLDAMLTVLRPY